MRRQHGFIQLSVLGWAAVAAGVIILGLGIALKVQSSRLDSCKKEFAIFQASVDALGKAAEAAARAKEAAQTKATKEIKDNAKKERDRIFAYYERWMRDRPGSGVVSAPANPTGRTDAPAAEPVASGPGFERACALDAQQVMAFQEWARKQGIPVR